MAIKGFTKYNNDQYALIASANFTKLERSVIDLIYRCTVGCMNREYAYLKQCDFTVFGLKENHAKEIIEKLITKKVINREKVGPYFRYSIDFNEVKKLSKLPVETFNDIIHRNIQKEEVILSRRRKRKVPDLGSLVASKDLNKAINSTTKESEEDSKEENIFKTNKKLNCLLRHIKNNFYHSNPERKIELLIEEYGIREVEKLINTPYPLWKETLENNKKKGEG